MTSKIDKKVFEIAEILKEELKLLDGDVSNDKDLTIYLCELQDCVQLLASFAYCIDIAYTKYKLQNKITIKE